MVTYKLVNSDKSVKLFADKLREHSGVIAIDFETSGLRPYETGFEVFTIGLTFDRTYKSYCIPCSHRESLVSEKVWKYLLYVLCRAPRVRLIAHNAAYELAVFYSVIGDRLKAKPVRGMLVPTLHDDTMLMHNRLYPFASNELKSIVQLRYGVTYGQEMDKYKKTSYGDAPLSELAIYNCMDTHYTMQLWNDLTLPLQQSSEYYVYRSVVMPGLHSLSRISYAGALVDVKSAANMATDYRRQLDEVDTWLAKRPEVIKTQKLWAQARQEKAMTKLLADFYKRYSTGTVDASALQASAIKYAEDRIKPVESYVVPFSSGSVQQKRILAFDVLKLRQGKVSQRTKLPSVDSAFLAKHKKHRIIGVLARRAKFEKMFSTYLKPVPKWVNTQDGRCHTNYTLSVTRTGRTSSTQPNLQNIPRESTIKGMFIPRTGCSFIQLDVSQAELRILACFSKDKNLLEAYHKNRDVHTMLSAYLFGVTEAEVTKDLRQAGKTLNFGVLYQMGPKAVAESLGVSETKAEKLVHGYFKYFAGVHRWINSVKSFARKNGFVESFIGRRRYLPDIITGKDFERSTAERQAVNTPIQGLASDMLLLTLPKLWAYLDGLGIGAQIVLTVHDSVVIECPDEHIRIVSESAKKIMEDYSAHNFEWLIVPWVVDVEIFPRKWGCKE